jgi:hypothetical protein
MKVMAGPLVTKKVGWTDRIYAGAGTTMKKLGTVVVAKRATKASAAKKGSRATAKKGSPRSRTKA